MIAGLALNWLVPLPFLPVDLPAGTLLNAKNAMVGRFLGGPLRFQHWRDIVVRHDKYRNFPRANCNRKICPRTKL